MVKRNEIIKKVDRKKNIKFIEEQLAQTIEAVKAPLFSLQSILDTIREPFLILDESLHVLQANRSFYNYFKIARKDTEHKLIYELDNHQWDIPELKKLLENIVPQNSYFDDFEVAHNFPNLGYRVMLLNARKVFADGARVLLAFEDITQKRELEKQKDEFATVVAHELKGPITIISGYMQLIEAYLRQKGAEKYVTYTEKTNLQIHRLTNLVNGLLHAGIIRATEFSLDKQPTDLDLLMETTITELELTTGSHKITTQGAKLKNILIDPDGIKQVLINLIVNAIKFSPNSNEVLINTVTDTNDVIISVQDFGIGISEENQKNVFQRYFQVKGIAKETYYGIGLGLDISSRIIRDHGGYMWVQSALGKGSTFYFSLPMNS